MTTLGTLSNSCPLQRGRSLASFHSRKSHFGPALGMVPLVWPLQESESTKLCSKAILPSSKCESDRWDCISYCARHTSCFPTVPGTWHSEWCITDVCRFLLLWWINEWLALRKKVNLSDKIPVQQLQKSRLINASAAFWMTGAAPYTLILICCAMKIFLAVTNDFESCLTFQEQMCWWFNRI